MAEKTSVSYKDLLESVVKYNTRLLQERRARIPYHDSSTNVSYHDGRRIYLPSERGQGSGTGQIFTYPSRRWKLKPRPPAPNPPPPPECPIPQFPQSTLFPADPINQNGLVPPAVGAVTPGVAIPNVCSVPLVEPNAATTASALRMFEDSLTNSRDSWSTQEACNPSETIVSGDGTESNEADFDTDDDFEDGSRRRRGGSKPPSKAGKARKDIDYTVVVGREKPFSCNYCDMTYKTRPGLTYHVTKEHPNGRVKTPVTTLPQPQVPSHQNSAQHQVPANFQQFQFQAAPPSAQKNAILSHPNADKSIQRDRDGRSVICDFCEIENATMKPAPKGEKLHSCASCGHSAHATCLGFTKNQRESTLQYPWKCIECKSCSLCNSAENDEKLLFCDDCDRGYHMYCLTPQIDATPEGLWSCDPCLAQYGDEAAFQVWKRKLQEEAVAKYQKDVEESTKRASSSSDSSRQRYSVKMEHRN